MTPPTNNPGEGNPAAERLRARRHVLSLMQVNPGWVGLNGRTPEQYAEEVLDAALLHERRATVERAGLKITAQQIRDALDVLGPTGDRAEAYVKAAALAMAYLLDATASEEEARP